MISNMGSRQNSRYALDLLAAQRALYRNVRLLRRLRSSIIGAGAAISCTVALVIARDPVVAGVATGAALLAISVATGGVEKRRKADAVAIQEEFDTHVYRMIWNPLLADRPTSEVVARNAARHRARFGDVGLSDWYPAADHLDRWTAVLLCQRANVSWDAPLHRRWAAALGVLLGVQATAMVLAGISGALTPAQWTAAVVAPMLAPAHVLFESLRTNLEHARQGARLDTEIHRRWRTATDGGASIGEQQCRQIQDQLFALRMSGPLVPDLFYRIRRASMHRIVQTQNDHLTTRAGGTIS